MKPFLKSRLMIILVVFLFTTSQRVNAQNEDLEQNEKLDSLSGIVEQLMDRINEDPQYEDVGKFVYFSRQVGVGYLKKCKEIRLKKGEKMSEPKCKKCTGPHQRTVNIESVHINIRDGSVVDMQVITEDDETFTNYYSPFSINLFNEGGYYLTYLNREGCVERMYLNRFIRWERMRGFNPKDDHFILTNESEKALQRGVGINHVVELSLFTDLTGLLGDKPNGITQTEAYTKIITNTSSVRYPFSNRRTSLVLLKYFAMRANFARFDTKYATTRLDSGFTRQKLLQRSHINVDLTANIFSTWLPRKSANWLSVNAGGGLYASSLSTSNDTTDAILPYFFVEPAFELRVAQNFAGDFSFRFMRQEAPQLETNAGWRWILRPQISLSWFAFGNPASKIFARFNLLNDLEDREHPIFQAQVGYVLRFSQLVQSNMESN